MRYHYLLVWKLLFMSSTVFLTFWIKKSCDSIFFLHDVEHGIDSLPYLASLNLFPVNKVRTVMNRKEMRNKDNLRQRYNFEIILWLHIEMFGWGYIPVAMEDCIKCKTISPGMGEIVNSDIWIPMSCFLCPA